MLRVFYTGKCHINSILHTIILREFYFVYLVHKPVVSLLARKQCCDHDNVDLFIFRARNSNVSGINSEDTVTCVYVCIHIAFFNIL